MAFKAGALVGNGDLTTGTITGNGQSIVIDVSAYGNITAAVSGTFAGVNVAFEVSVDGTTWYGTQMTRSNASTLEGTSGVLGATPAYVWEASVNGVNWFRVRSTAYTSGTQTWQLLPGMYPTEPAPVVGVAGTPSFALSGAIATPSGTAYSATTAASTNAASVKASAGNLFEITVSNPTATATFVKLYNKASAPTVGTDVPVLTIPAAAGVTVALAFGQNGKRFATGIAVAATAAAAATDTAVAVAGVQIHATYI